MKYKRIGDFLKFEFLEKYEISENQLAMFLKVNQNRINEIIRGRRRITPNTDLRLCKFFELEDGYFLQIQNRIELMQELEKNSELFDSIISYKVIYSE
ncbi:MAG: HigA family addiction module antitoxin [Alphaproteobacteria bacterium]|nr:HigA family addiction module antitoxin [Alphaproteobacteria bacterium]